MYLPKDFVIDVLLEVLPPTSDLLIKHLDELFVGHLSVAPSTNHLQEVVALIVSQTYS